MDKNRVKIEIAGQEYYITSEEEVSYIRALGEELDEEMKSLLNSNARLSMTQAAVLCAFDYIDKFHKSQDDTESIRSQIQIYMEDAAESKTEAEMAKREVEKMTRDLKNIKRSLDEKNS